MSLFRQVVIREPTQATLKTLRYTVFAIGAYIVRDGNRKILKLSLANQQRDWFLGLWEGYKTLTFPHPVPG
jgi:hypothetical protein